MSSEDADESSVGDSSFEEEVLLGTLPPSPFSKGTNEPFDVVLKGGSPWGFKLKGGSEVKTSLQIAELEAESKAELSGKLQVNDYVLCVNGVRCPSKTEALQLIHSAFRTLTLHIWRGTTEPLSSPVRTQSFLQKARELQERARHQASVQDDSAVYTESKSSSTFRMKPRQRRIESFHGRRPSHQSAGPQPSSASASSLPQRPHGDQEQAPLSPPPATDPTLGLKGWATEHDLSSGRVPVIMSGRGTPQNPRPNPLSPAKSTPTLNQEEPPVKSPRGYSPIQYKPMSMTKSTPDIADSSGHDNVTSPTSPRSPSWYQQRFPSRSNVFDFSGAAVRRGSGSPRNSYAGYPSSGYTQPLGSYPHSVPYSQPSSSSNSFPQPYSASYSQSYQSPPQGSTGPSYSYDDTPSRPQSSGRNYDRRSLPPQMPPAHHSVRPEFLKENVKPESQGSRQSMPVTREEDESDRDLTDVKAQPPDESDPRSMYSPPAPPVRDISSLKYVGYSQSHEKYPSWPVTMANPPPNLSTAPLDAHPGLGPTESEDREAASRQAGAQGNTTDTPSSTSTSTGLERKNSDESKQPRNQSDPGFKKPKKNFYTARRPVQVEKTKDRDYENTKSVEERFEDFVNQSKPGYPPPKFDQDGHNYGDEKYCVPSPPERDMPNLDQKTLVEKIAEVISPSSASYHQFHTEAGGGGRAMKSDMATSPLQSPMGSKVPGMYFQQAMNAKNLLHPQSSPAGTMVDSGTSPLGSPTEERNKLSFRNASARNSVSSSAERARGLIIKQMPYYNTSTQTDDFNQFLHQSQQNRHSAEFKDPSRFTEKSIQAQMSHSSVSSDSDSNMRHSDSDRNSRQRKPFPSDSRSHQPISMPMSVSRSDSSTQGSGVPGMFATDTSSAPLLRKLSEEFYGGRISGSYPNEKRLSSASTMEELKSPRSESSYGGLKEAGSYSSVVIHPQENSMPFGRDDFGSHPSLTSSKQDLSGSDRETSQSRSSKSSRHSMDPSMFLHKPMSSMSAVPPRGLQDSRFTSESNLSAGGYGATRSSYGGSMMQLPMSRASYTDGNQSRTYMYSSSDSSSSYPRGSMEARSSGGSRVGSDSSTSGVSSLKSGQNFRKESDSVFFDKSSPLATDSQKSESPSLGNAGEDSRQQSFGIGRKESMKLAYGTFDENERHYATPYGHQRNHSEVLSQPVASDNVAHGRSASFSDYMPMYGSNQNERLGQITEDPAESHLQDSFRKTRSEARESAANYMNVDVNKGEVTVLGKGGDSDKSDNNTDVKQPIESQTRRRQSKSEQSKPHRVDKMKQESDSVTPRPGLTGDASSGAESAGSKGNKSDSDSAPGASLSQQASDSDLKKVQQKAVLDFVERKTKWYGPNGSEPTSPVQEIPPSLQVTAPDKPAPSTATASTIITDYTRKYNYTKAQRQESLRRTRSISSNSSRDSSDYVDMKRPERNYYQTEWSKLRPKTGELRRPLSIGSDASGFDNYVITGLSPLSTPDGDTSHIRSISDVVAARDQQTAAMADTVDDSAPPNSSVAMVTSPIYQNVVDYPHRPPPPLPAGSPEQDQPPALPPRGHRFQSSKSESYLLSRLDPKQVQELQKGSTGSSQEVSSSEGLEDSYTLQLRKASRRFSEQHKPIPMTVLSTKSQMQISLTKSYKPEPVQALEAKPLQRLAVSPSPTPTPTPPDPVKDHSSPPAYRGYVRSPEPPPLPTPLKNGDLEYKIDLNDTADFPPPPPNVSGSGSEGRGDDSFEDLQRCADDSYGSYKSKTNREVGRYKRTVSDSNVLRDSKLRTENNNNIKDLEIPNKPPRKKLELQGHESPKLPRSSPVAAVGSEQGVSVSPNLGPSFQAMAEVSPVQTVSKSVAKPLSFANRERSHVSPPGGNIVSTVVQRPMLNPPSQTSTNNTPDKPPSGQERTSVKDRIKNIEVFAQSPAGPKLMSPKSLASGPGAEEFETSFDFPSKSRDKEAAGRGEQGSDRNSTSSSLENLSSSVKSSNSFRDRLKPVVKKIENETSAASEEQQPYRGGDNKVPDSVRSDETPPLPSRTYRQQGTTVEDRGVRNGMNDSFNRQRGPAMPRPYENKGRSYHSPVGVSGSKTQQGAMRDQSRGQGPEPQVPPRVQPLSDQAPVHRSHETTPPLPSHSDRQQHRDRHTSGDYIPHRSRRSDPEAWAPNQPKQDQQFNREKPREQQHISSPKRSPHNSGGVESRTDLSYGQGNPTANSGQGRREPVPQKPEPYSNSRMDDSGKYSEKLQSQDSRVDYSNKRDISGNFPHRQRDGREGLPQQAEQRGDNSFMGDRQRTPVMDASRQSPGQPPHGYQSGDPRNWQSSPANQNYSSHNRGNKSNTPPTKPRASDQSVTKNSAKEQNLNNRNDGKDSSAQEGERSKHKPVPAKLPPPGLVVNHGRQPSQDELECNEKAQELARVLPESDKKLSEVLTTDSSKSRMQYMNGLFTMEPEMSPPTRPRTASKRNNSASTEKPEEEEKKEPHSPMPSNYYVSSSKAMIELELRKIGDTSEITKDIGDNEALKQKKEELLQRMMKKVDTLREDKKELLLEIDDNDSLGKQVLKVVEAKCKSQYEIDKFKSYVEDMEKIIRLLLKLSGLLARAENAIQGLTEGTNEKIKKMTYEKRDKLHQQHEEAKELKADIDRRKDTVLCILQQCLSPADLEDYDHFIRMKSKNTIQMQELDDKITLGQEQIQALQKSIPNPKK